MSKNGSPEPEFVTDNDRISLTVTLPVHPTFRKINFAKIKLTPTGKQVLRAAKGSAISINTISGIIQTKATSGALRRAISNLLEAGLLAYTIPDKPNSRLQQYTVTPNGEEFLEFLDKQEEFPF